MDDARDRRGDGARVELLPRACVRQIDGPLRVLQEAGDARGGGGAAGAARGARLTERVPRQPVRSASTGSIRAARRAGIQAAASPIPTSNTVTAPNVSGSVGLTSNNSERITRVVA